MVRRSLFWAWVLWGHRLSSGKVRFLTAASQRCLHAGLAHWPVGWMCRRLDFKDVGGAANMTREMFRSLTVKRESRGVVQVDRLATGGADRRVHGNLPKLGGHLAPCHRGLDVRSTSTLKNSNSGNADTTPNSRQRKNYLQTGGLLSYGPNEPDMLSAGSNLRRQDPQGRQTRRSSCRAAHEVRPGTQSETAKALGLTIPPSLLQLAYQLIE
jgi:hypothetical protein